MAQPTKPDQPMDQSHALLLRLMKPGVWYCASEFAGCDAMPSGEWNMGGRALSALVGRGFVECLPVFEGFMTMKHRITPEGIAWLAAR